MFQIQQFINHKYRTVSRARSLGGAGLKAQSLVQTGKFRVLSPKGQLVILSGRVLPSGKVVFDK